MLSLDELPRNFQTVFQILGLHGAPEYQTEQSDDKPAAQKAHSAQRNEEQRTPKYNRGYTNVTPFHAGTYVFPAVSKGRLIRRYLFVRLLLTLSYHLNRCKDFLEIPY
jgi:hypothetical protein